MKFHLLYLVALLTAIVFILVDNGLDLLNKPSNLAVSTGILCILTAIVTVGETVQYILRKRKRKDETNIHVWKPRD